MDTPASSSLFCALQHLCPFVHALDMFLQVTLAASLRWRSASTSINSWSHSTSKHNSQSNKITLPRCEILADFYFVGGGVDLICVVRQWPCKMIAMPVLTNSLLMSLPMGSTKMHGTDPRFSTSKSTCRPPSFWADSPGILAMKWVGAFLDSYSCLVMQNQCFECSQVFQVLQRFKLFVTMNFIYMWTASNKTSYTSFIRLWIPYHPGWEGFWHDHDSCENYLLIQKLCLERRLAVPARPLAPNVHGQEFLAHPCCSKWLLHGVVHWPRKQNACSHLPTFANARFGNKLIEIRCLDSLLLSVW